MRRALPAFAAGITLVTVWPSSQSAFHEPKGWLFLSAAIIGALLTLPRWRWTALPLLALTAVQPWRSPEAGLQALAFAWALAAWPSLQPDLRHFTRVTGIAAAVVSLVVLLQALGLDVLAFASPEVGQTRLRLYGTLGNPDFVASALLPVALLLLAPPQRSSQAEKTSSSRSEKPSSSQAEKTSSSRAEKPSSSQAEKPRSSRAESRDALLSLLLIIPALVLTRSFATLLSAIVAALVLIIHRRRAGLPAVLVLCGVLIAGLIGRDLSSAIAGRRYLVSVALPHLLDAPLLGQGLGATVQQWPDWELSYWQARCPDAACVAADPQSRFAALQDHVHSDLLEWVLERGLFGLLALLLALGAPLLWAWRRSDVESSFLLAALAAALARTLVDFPLHRPADLCLIAALAACAQVSPSSTPPSQPS